MEIFLQFSKVVMPDKNGPEINQIWESMAEKFNFKPEIKVEPVK